MPTSTVEFLCAYVSKQKRLVRDLFLKSSELTDELDLRDKTCSEVQCDGELWKVVPHGAGVRFENVASKEVVDVHLGLFEAPDAFDIWRLEENADSVGFEPDGNDWEKWITENLDSGVLVRHNTLSKHFVLHQS